VLVPAWFRLTRITWKVVDSVLVRCERVIGPLGLGAVSSWLTVGGIYPVVSMLFGSSSTAQVQVHDDSGGPSWWRRSMFTQVTGAIPRNWAVEMTPDGLVGFAPNRFGVEGFWESFFDGDAAAGAIYAEELAVIRACDPLP
jgi:hypothetical protein